LKETEDADAMEVAEGTEHVEEMKDIEEINVLPMRRQRSRRFFLKWILMMRMRMQGDQ
jgi:hypothetical protein